VGLEAAYLAGFKLCAEAEVSGNRVMKDARELYPTNSYQKMLQEYDLREIDALDRRSLFCRKYMARLDWVLQTIQRELPPGSLVLEVGCSQANASLLLAEQGYRCIGLDIRPQALTYALCKHTEGPFYAVVGSAELLPFVSGQLDGIIIGEMLEHCAQPTAIMRGCVELVRSGGIVVITTPNGQYLGLHDPLYRPETERDAQVQRYQFLRDTHVFTFTALRLRELLTSCGLEVMECEYVGSVVYSDRYFPLKRIMTVAWLDRLSRLVNRVPGLNRLLSYTLVAVARKR